MSVTLSVIVLLVVMLYMSSPLYVAVIVVVPPFVGEYGSEIVPSSFVVCVYVTSFMFRSIFWYVSGLFSSSVSFPVIGTVSPVCNSVFVVSSVRIVFIFLMFREFTPMLVLLYVEFIVAIIAPSYSVVKVYGAVAVPLVMSAVASVSSSSL